MLNWARCRGHVSLDLSHVQKLDTAHVAGRHVSHDLSHVQKLDTAHVAEDTCPMTFHMYEW